MKKLLILMLVLGMASLANAITVATYTNLTQGNADATAINNLVGDVIEVMLSTNAADMGGLTNFSIDVDHSSLGVAWTNPAGWLLPPLGSVAPLPPTGERFSWTNGTFGFPPAAQNWVSATFTIPASAYPSPGGITISYNGTIGLGNPPTQVFVAIPEPMTVALLGLGGLLLLRCRK